MTASDFETGATCVAVGLSLLAYAWLVRPALKQRREVGDYVYKSQAYTGLLDGALAGAPLAEAALTVNPHVIDALGRLKIHSADTGTILQHFRADHAAMVSGHFIEQLKGYVAESIVADHFAALGHHVVLATTTNQAAWDLLIDGHPFQVKSGATAFQHGLEHLQAHPNIPVITDPSAAHDLLQIDPGAALAVHDIAAAKLEATTSASVHGIDAIAHAGAVHMPVVTIAFSSYKEITRLCEGNTDFSSALTHVAIDAVGVGAGMALGAKGGVTIGSFLGIHGAAVGGFLGGIVGGVAGKLAATFGKEARLRALIARYQEEVQDASLAFRAAEQAASEQFFGEAQELDARHRTALNAYAGALRNAQKLHAAAVRHCEGAVLFAAWRTRGIRTSDVRTALRALHAGDRHLFARVAAEAERLGATKLQQAFRKYIAVLYQLETDIVAGIRQYDAIISEAADEGRSAATDILEDLSARAVDLYSVAEDLRSDIETELRKLGKSLPVTPALAPGK